MAFTAAQLAALEAALARGVRQVSYNGESVTYGSLAEMQTLRRQMRKELGLAVTAVKRFPTVQREG